MYEIIHWGDDESYPGKQDGEVGVGGLTDIDHINSRAEFSLYIAPEHQQKGYGKIALKRLVEHGFNVLNLNSIWGECFDGNPAARMFESIGFKKTGTRPQFYYRDGRYINADIYTLLRAEYNGLDSVIRPDVQLDIIAQDDKERKARDKKKAGARSSK